MFAPDQMFSSFYRGAQVTRVCFLEIFVGCLSAKAVQSRSLQHLVASTALMMYSFYS